MTEEKVPKKRGRKPTGLTPRKSISFPKAFLTTVDSLCGGSMKRVKFIMKACEVYISLSQSGEFKRQESLKLITQKKRELKKLKSDLIKLQEEFVNEFGEEIVDAVDK